MTVHTRISPSLWFDFNAKEAVDFYMSVFPNSKVLHISYYHNNSHGPEGEIMTIRFQLDGFVFTAINGGPQYKFNESVSFMVECKDQAEADFYSNALLAGGQKSYGGWLKDRFGLSWQINRKSPATKPADCDNADAHRT